MVAGQPCSLERVPLDNHARLVPPRTQSVRVWIYGEAMPPQNPMTRIEQVAIELGRLADELEGYLGASATRILLYWRAELLAALDDLQRGSGTAPAA